MTMTNHGSIFVNFCRQAYDTVTTEPFISRFKEFSEKGDRQGMVQVIIELPCVLNTKITKSYKGKNDEQATLLYQKSLNIMKDGENKAEEESRACSVLTEALFAASACSLVFMNALLERAKYWYKLGAWINCLKDSECLLALPQSFYDKNVDSKNVYLKHKKECYNFKHECSKKLEITIRRKQKIRGKENAKYCSSAEIIKKRTVVSTPTMHGKLNNSLKSCSDAVELRFDNNRGRHLVATRDICAGSVLIVDQPFSSSIDKETLDRNCLHCYSSLKLEDNVRIPCYMCQTVSYCTEACRSESWEMYHKYECPILNIFFEEGFNEGKNKFSHLLLAYRTTLIAALSPIEKKHNNTERMYKSSSLNTEFFKHHQSKEKDTVISNANKIYDPLDYTTVLQLESHCTNVDPNVNAIRSIEAVFIAKCLIFSFNEIGIDSLDNNKFIALATATLQHLQAINYNAYEIVENVRNEVTHVWEPRNVGCAIYTTVSLTNHSCYPNVVRHSYSSGKVVVRTLRCISKGNEILDCYGPQFLSEEKLARREYLWKKYLFMCECDACKYNWRLPLPDMLNFKCKTCSQPSFTETKNGMHKIKHCPQCNKKLDYQKLKKQLRRSVEKRVNAISKMYQGYYEEALNQLLDHIDFVEKFLETPNIESIKTQQCLIQCYNSFGCISTN
ncbi:PREDICTED: SET and MYND domain-containing protein 4-like [Polistes canadensis]|uniref:SET and MYND domain-containing protein 4-like n=1 Tax=Polistes canadensis TaxID=91411 RepID=UPI000718B925|nr:PREDICTED: SET and MYND domain-containing protein 4-like [Polistes canadensis]